MISVPGGAEVCLPAHKGLAVRTHIESLQGNLQLDYLPAIHQRFVRDAINATILGSLDSALKTRSAIFRLPASLKCTESTKCVASPGIPFSPPIKSAR